ncbi:MAG: hypothetical protein ACRD17_12310 [Terriglobales bacterium]
MNPSELAGILLREQESIIQIWLEKIAATPSLTALPMTPVLRRDHGHQILGDVALRLRGERTIRAADAAERYSAGRIELGYTPEMETEELMLLILAARDVVAAKSNPADLLPVLTELFAAAHQAVVTAVRLRPPGPLNPALAS